MAHYAFGFNAPYELNVPNPGRTAPSTSVITQLFHRSAPCAGAVLIERSRQS
jgi:hypothetical protein